MDRTDGSPAMPFRARDARLTARLAMSGTARRMGDVRRRDPVAYADLRTSMDDHRAAFSIAGGVPLDRVDRDGFNTSSPTSRAYDESRAVLREARRFPEVRGDGRAARHAADLMAGFADAMGWAEHQSRDRVAWADARGSMGDARAAWALANGAEPTESGRSGHRIDAPSQSG